MIVFLIFICFHKSIICCRNFIIHVYIRSVILSPTVIIQSYSYYLFPYLYCSLCYAHDSVPYHHYILSYLYYMLFYIYYVCSLMGITTFHIVVAYLHWLSTFHQSSKHILNVVTNVLAIRRFMQIVLL